MKCIHHIDADGYGAAAIVRHELLEIFMPPTEKDFIPYNYGMELHLPEDVRPNEPVYFVDLSLNDTIFNAIKYFVEKGANVVHIDHHLSGARYYTDMSDEDKRVYDTITHLYNPKYSGCMLTWVYACMNPDEKLHPETVEFDFTEGFTHVGFWPGTENFREYSIPMAVRYIDDNDVWRHAIPETKYFIQYFNMEKHLPMDDEFWTEMLYSSTNHQLVEMVETGEILYKYQTQIDKSMLKHSFDITIDGLRIIALNRPYGNSRIFCEKYDEYDAVLKFYYDGAINKWRYSIYSNGNNPDVDCALIAVKYFNGGGHKLSAAGMTDELIINQFVKSSNYVGNTM